MWIIHAMEPALARLPTNAWRRAIEAERERHAKSWRELKCISEDENVGIMACCTSTRGELQPYVLTKDKSLVDYHYNFF